MFHFRNDGPGNGDQGQDGDRFTRRVEAMEYDLAVQRGDVPSAAQALALLLGQALQNGGGR